MPHKHRLFDTQSRHSVSLIESNAKLYLAQSVLTFIGGRFKRSSVDVRSDAVARRNATMSHAHSTTATPPSSGKDLATCVVALGS
jgi:hypothetical protein